MKKYRKLIVAVIGAIFAGLSAIFGVNLEAMGVSVEMVMGLIVPILTAAGVWAVPNDTA